MDVRGLFRRISLRSLVFCEKVEASREVSPLLSRIIVSMVVRWKKKPAVNVPPVTPTFVKFRTPLDSDNVEDTVMLKFAILFADVAAMEPPSIVKMFKLWISENTYSGRPLVSLQFRMCNSSRYDICRNVPVEIMACPVGLPVEHSSSR